MKDYNQALVEYYIDIQHNEIANDFKEFELLQACRALCEKEDPQLVEINQRLADLNVKYLRDVALMNELRKSQ